MFLKVLIAMRSALAIPSNVTTRRVAQPFHGYIATIATTRFEAVSGTIRLLRREGFPATSIVLLHAVGLARKMDNRRGVQRDFGHGHGENSWSGELPGNILPQAGSEIFLNSTPNHMKLYPRNQRQLNSKSIQADDMNVNVYK